MIYIIRKSHNWGLVTILWYVQVPKRKRIHARKADYSGRQLANSIDNKTILTTPRIRSEKTQTAGRIGNETKLTADRIGNWKTKTAGRIGNGKTKTAGRISNG